MKRGCPPVSPRPNCLGRRDAALGVLVHVLYKVLEVGNRPFPHPSPAPAWRAWCRRCRMNSGPHLHFVLLCLWVGEIRPAFRRRQFAAGERLVVVTQSPARRDRCLPCGGLGGLGPLLAPGCSLGSVGDLYTSVRPSAAACRCGSPVPAHQTSIFRFARFRADLRVGLARLRRVILVLMPVSASNLFFISSHHRSLRLQSRLSCCACIAGCARDGERGDGGCGDA